VLLAVVMCIVLLASVAVAYLLVVKRGVPAQRGAQIISQIRNEGLGAYWTDQPVALRYLGKDPEGRVRAVMLVSRQAIETGYSGTRRLQTEAGLLLEQWTLSSDARRGAYSGPTGTVEPSTTTILLENGKASVVQNTRRGIKAAESPAPDNYIPEGMQRLVVQQVARSGKQAVFSGILNSEAIAAGRVRFATIAMKPLDAQTVTVTWRGVASRMRSVYHLDKQGRIVAIDETDPQIRFELQQQPAPGEVDESPA